MSKILVLAAIHMKRGPVKLPLFYTPNMSTTQWVAFRDIPFYKSCLSVASRVLWNDLHVATSRSTVSYRCCASPRREVQRKSRLDDDSGLAAARPSRQLSEVLLNCVVY